MQAHRRELRVPLTFVQAGVDRLVAPANADFVRTVLPAGQLRVSEMPGEGHFLLWDRPQVVTDAVVDMVSRSRSCCANSQSVARNVAAPSETLQMR